MRRAIVGCLLGTAVGDAIGLPGEGLSRRKQRCLFGDINRHRLFFGRGMVSDDTEHAIMVAQALLASNGDPGEFTRALGRQMRRWLLLLPAGVGWATLRATGKMLVGVPPTHSGVFSAGNGSAMRAPMLGVCSGDDPGRLRALVRASTRLTHTDPRAECGALAVAIAAWQSSQEVADTMAYSAALDTALCGADATAAQTLRDLISGVVNSVVQRETTVAYAARAGMGEGVSGFIYHTVPLVIHVWLSHPRDLRNAVLSALACGGDTDTTAAIVGGIVGAGVGKDGIPAPWLAGLCEWPCSVAWMERLGARLSDSLATGQKGAPLSAFAPAILLRNLFFLGVVLSHGLRRLLPPY